YVEDGAANHADDLGLLERRRLKMHAANRATVSRQRQTALRDAGVQPPRGEFVRHPGAREQASLVLEHIRRDDEDTGDVRRGERHEVQILCRLTAYGLRLR